MTSSKSKKITDYAKKYKTRANFDKQYKPLEFKLLGIKFREHLPFFPSFLDPVIDTYAYWRSRLGFQFSYFNVRFGFTQTARKEADMHFITHYIQDHIRTSQKARFSEALHYHLIKLRYLPELTYVNSIVYSPEAPNHPKQPVIDLYLLRWHYLLDVKPSFVDLVHGVDRDTAMDTMEHFY